MVYQNTPTFEFEEGRWNTGTARGTAGAAVAAATNIPGLKGFFVAWDPVANAARWRIDFRPSGGALSTAGQLVFVGENGGTFMALDPATGKTLWEHKLATGIATPITYELDGKQYVAVMSGISGGKVYAFTLDGK
jgi:glucose dehydrogenase